MHSHPLPLGAPQPLAGLRVLVASHVRLYREGIAGILAAAGGQVVALADAEPHAALAALATDATPDVAVVDTTMPGALATMRRLAALHPSLHVVALGVTDEADDVAVCAEAGAAGYVARDSGAAELVAALGSAARGEALCSPRIAAGLFRRLAARHAPRHAPRHGAGATSSLTPREREVLALIDRGLSNKEIAARLRIGVTTVKNHVHRILEKLHAERRGEAAALARDAAVLP